MTEPLTHTKRSMFKSCRRKFYFRFERGLELAAKRPGRRRGHAFGRAIMDVLEAVDGGAEGLDLNEVAVTSIAKSYEEVSARNQEEQDEIDFELTVLEALVFAYLDRYPIRSRREIEYHLPLVNPATGRRSRTFHLAGKIDGAITTGPKHVRLVEDKLNQQITKVMIDRLELDEQITEYVLAFAEKGWSADVEYRYTRWPSIRQKQKETSAQFRERFLQDLADRPDFYFESQLLVFPVAQLERFRRHRWAVARDIMLARRQGEDSFYLNPSVCFEYGGCEYLPLCTLQPGAGDLYRVVGDTPELDYKEEE